MRSENGYIGFNLVIGALFLVAGYLVDSLLVVLGLQVMGVCVIVCITAKLQEKKSRVAEESYEYLEMKEATAHYILK